MLAKIQEFIKQNQKNILLATVVILISLLSFAIGYLVAKYQQKEPLRFEEAGLFFQGLETFAAMKFTVNIAQSLVGYMGVDLGSHDISVT